jgi:hypothetical protein
LSCCRFPHIALFASKPIKKGDVLGFDYGEKFWVIKHKFFTCWCGGDKCKYSKTAIGKTLENYYKNLEEETEKQQQQAATAAAAATGGRLKLKLRMEEGKVVKVDDSGLLPDEPDIERRTPKLEPKKARSPKREDHRKSPKLEDVMKREDSKSPALIDKKVKQEVKMEVDEKPLMEAVEIKKKKKESRLSIESKIWKGVAGGSPTSPVVMLPKASKAIGKEIAKTQKLIDGLKDEIAMLTQAKNNGGGESSLNGGGDSRSSALPRGVSSRRSSPLPVLTPPPPPPALPPLPAGSQQAAGSPKHVATATLLERTPSPETLTGSTQPPAIPTGKELEEAIKSITNGHAAEESPAELKRSRGRPKKNNDPEKGKKMSDGGGGGEEFAVVKPRPSVVDLAVNGAPNTNESSALMPGAANGTDFRSSISGSSGDSRSSISGSSGDSRSSISGSCGDSRSSVSGSSSDSRPSTPGESPGRPRRHNRKLMEKDS